MQLFIILHYDQQMHTIFSQIITLLHVSTLSCHHHAACNQPCQLTPVSQMQLSVIQFTIKMFHTGFMQVLILQCGPGQLSRYSDWLRAGRSGDRILAAGEIFRTCPDRPWGQPSLLYNGYRVFPGGKERPGRDADPSPLLVPWSRKSRAKPLLPYWPYGLYTASVSVQG